MDESSSYLPSEGPPSPTRLRFRKHTASISSQASTVHPVRLRTPAPQNRFPTANVISNGSESEILAPVPRRHYNLQASESSNWLGSPTLSASSSRPVSPFALNPDGTILFGPSRRRLNRQLSFSSLMEHTASPLTPHTPRKGRNIESAHECGMARRWVRWMHKQGLKDCVIPCAVLASVWVKWAVGLGSYSGQGTPPMFGDYEAQRHWMELTIHLPAREWYTYDLQYWGLDYPPLTAYISWICGIIGSWLDPTWFALDESRGIESHGSKVYLRTTVLVLDTLVYLPAIMLFVRLWHRHRSSRTQETALLALLFHPALLLIDFGHFQYNSVMLGLTILALNCFASGSDLLGAFFFVLSLGFKQMALYYAPAIGSYLLGKCLYLGSVKGIKHFSNLALVTVATTLLLFLVFLPPFAPLSAIMDPITRIFPFNRGLFEDKVANFWCASDVVLKWRKRFTAKALVRMATGLTAGGFLPAAAGLIYSGWGMRLQPPHEKDDAKDRVDIAKAVSEPAPIIALLPYALLASSMSFFLFSFQVHEKTILLPLLPLTLLLSGVGEGSETWEVGMLVNNVAVFSMWPLLKRDGLGVQYIALIVLWNRLLGYNPFCMSPKSMLQVLSLATHTACIVLHVIEALFSPPARYPDLFPVLNVLLSAPIFTLVWLWSVRRGVEVGWALGGLGFKSSHAAKPVSKDDANGHEHETTEGAAIVHPFPSDKGGLGREAGARTVSLGYTQGRRRLARTHRTGSISSVLSATSHPGREREPN